MKYNLRTIDWGKKNNRDMMMMMQNYGLRLMRTWNDITIDLLNLI